MGVLLSNTLVALHDGSITSLNSREILILNIHVLTQLAIRCRSKKTMKNMLHLGIAIIYRIIYLQHLTVFAILVCLVEYTQHLNKTIIHATMQIWYLNNNTVMNKTLDKRVGHTFSNLLTIIVV